jgi:hypothetical protein
MIVRLIEVFFCKHIAKLYYFIILKKLEKDKVRYSLMKLKLKEYYVMLYLFK